MVDIDGTIWRGRDIYAVGVHTLGNNGDSIGIAFQGRYDDRTQEMPCAQFNAGVWLIRHVFEQFGVLKILGHREAAASACPGRFFPLDKIRDLSVTPQPSSDELTCAADSTIPLSARYRLRTPIAGELFRRLLKRGLKSRK